MCRCELFATAAHAVRALDTRRPTITQWSPPPSPPAPSSVRDGGTQRLERAGLCACCGEHGRRGGSSSAWGVGRPVCRHAVPPTPPRCAARWPAAPLLACAPVLPLQPPPSHHPTIPPAHAPTCRAAGEASRPTKAWRTWALASESSTTVTCSITCRQVCVHVCMLYQVLVVPVTPRLPRCAAQRGMSGASPAPHDPQQHAAHALLAPATQPRRAEDCDPNALRLRGAPAARKVRAHAAGRRQAGGGAGALWTRRRAAPAAAPEVSGGAVRQQASAALRLLLPQKWPCRGAAPAATRARTCLHQEERSPPSRPALCT